MRSDAPSAAIATRASQFLRFQPGPIASSTANLESGAINTTAITICVQDLRDPSVHAGHIFVVDERAQ
jgi:hypothetical protein